MVRIAIAILAVVTAPIVLCGRLFWHNNRVYVWLYDVRVCDCVCVCVSKRRQYNKPANIHPTIRIIWNHRAQSGGQWKTMANESIAEWQQQQ